MSQDLLWSWGLHRSLDSGEKGRHHQGACLGKSGVEKRSPKDRWGSLSDGGQWEVLGSPRPTLPPLPMLTRAAPALLFQAPRLQAQVSQLLAQVPDEPGQGLLKAWGEQDGQKAPSPLLTGSLFQELMGSFTLTTRL